MAIHARERDHQRGAAAGGARAGRHAEQEDQEHQAATATAQGREPPPETGWVTCRSGASTITSSAALAAA